MATKMKRRHSKRKLTIPLAVVAGFIPMGMDIYNATKSTDKTDLLRVAVHDITGLNIGDPAHPHFDMDGFKRGLFPIAAGFAIHKFIGGSLGLNRALASAHIPFIRI